MSELLCDTCRAKLQAIAVGERDLLTATEAIAFDEINEKDQRDFKELLFEIVRDQQENLHVRGKAIDALVHRLIG